MEMMNKHRTDMRKPIDAEVFQEKFGEQYKSNTSLARFTSARIGGLADGLLTANSVDDLVVMVTYLWEEELPFIILGGGSNVLVSDAGVRGIVILNKARDVVFNEENEPPTVWAASGSNFGQVARQAGLRGLGGLEWAAGIPGTIGGAVLGNAGAHGGDVAGNLLMAEILHREIEDKRSKNGNPPSMLVEREQWKAEKLGFSYRSSLIKEQQLGKHLAGEDKKLGWLDKNQPSIVILAALMHLAHRKREDVEALINEYSAYRRKTQPAGASMGSMFKNPAGDFAGRLIEEAGLKGIRVGDAAISSLHGNFFINYGSATSADVWDLISLAKNIVASKFGIDLELEIELIGAWHVQQKS
jgi:UDP-N-acetylmuramate dehydrogenase